MPKFSDILVKAAESIERPLLPPKGTYTFVVTGLGKVRETKGFEVVDFPLRGIATGEDVDADEMKKYGQPKNIVARKSIMFNTEDENEFARGQFELMEFLTVHLGGDPRLSMKELMNNAVNKKCLGVLDYRPDRENPEILYVNIKKTAPIE